MRARTGIARSLFALSVALAAACGGHGRDGESTSSAPQAFDSAESVLLDFDVDGRLVADTADPAVLRRLVQAQLLYSVGALNADVAVGRLERVALSQVTASPRENAGSFLVTYHAVLPVAWSRVERPATYTLTLPAQVGEEDQKRFTAKYGKSCVEAGAGELTAADAGRMFYEFRPQREGCALDPADVVTLSASVSPSKEQTSGKYPEYQRIWEDGALDVVVLFSRSAFESGTDDEGIRAFGDFVARVEAYLRGRQPDPAKVIADAPSPSTERRIATLPDGRTVRIDAALVGTRLASDGPALDTWYDALTPSADLIVYSGHAGLGANVRALTSKGTFVPRKYVVWVLNGCDTFAYLDRTLAERRAVLNPDDPEGTKYMDTVSTAMGGFFSTGAATTMTFVDAMIGARDAGASPRTYRGIFTDIDPRQVTVVTGEEDNAFDPSTFAAPAGPSGSGGATSAPSVEQEPGSTAAPTPAPTAGSGSGPEAAAGASERGGSCSASTVARSATGGAPEGCALATVLALAVARARRRHHSHRHER